MSADTRPVLTDALATLGTIHAADGKRDAIHLAVISIVAGANLKPGEHVRIDSDGLAVSAYGEEGIGIVDPFIRSELRPGQGFWLVAVRERIDE